MRVLISICLFICFSNSVMGQTIETSKEFYFTAKESFNNKNYTEAINQLDLSEKTGGGANVYIQILRVKCYLAKNDYESAKSALDKSYNYKIPEKTKETLNELSKKVSEADKKLYDAEVANRKKKKEELSQTNRNRFKNLTVAKENKDREEKEAVELKRNLNDEKLWDKAVSLHTVKSYKDYKGNPLGINHRNKVDNRIDKIIWNKAFRLNTSEGYKEYLYNTVISESKKKHYDQAISYITKDEYKISRNKSYTKMPRDIAHYVNLKFLYIYQIGLRSLPKNIGDLSIVEKILLSKNELISLPKSFGNLTKLRRLFLEDNQLRKLPVTFGNLSSLEYCDLSNNQLKSLPESIGNLTQLKELYLARNDLRSLPKSFVNLRSLERMVIDKWSYKIKEVKKIIKELKKRNRFLKVYYFK